MTAERFDAILGELLRRQPFEVFTIELTSGKRLEVDHPNAVSFRDGIAAFVGPGTILSLFDNEGVVRLVDTRSSAEAEAGA
ncbi:MAG: hypothetical protein ACRC33_30600 [Gemmataceae bacterium]